MSDVALLSPVVWFYVWYNLRIYENFGSFEIFKKRFILKKIETDSRTVFHVSDVTHGVFYHVVTF